MNGTDVYQGLLDRGYQPVQAAALAGNILQESGGNPNALNEKEGANGLLQWRQDRLGGLQSYAKSVGAAPNDPNVQLDYIRQEMSGPESRSAAPFLSAPDLASANAALKGYIRYGDKSEGARLANAQNFLKQAPLAMGGPPQAQPQQAPQQAPAPQQAAQAAAGPSAMPNYEQAPAPLALLPPRPKVDLAQVFAHLQRG